MTGIKGKSCLLIKPKKMNILILACWCAIVLSVSLIASAQYIQIQALPQTVDYRENDLNIVCSITNPSQLKAVFFIQLLKNSSTIYETVVSIYTGQTPFIHWKDISLQNRGSVTGNVDSPSTAQLQLTIDKNSVQCPTDFKMYKCRMIGLSSTDDNIVAAESNIIAISYTVKPSIIELPRVRIFNEAFDTPNRQFLDGTAITLTCQGEVGNNPNKTIRWCAKKSGELSFTGLPQTPIHSKASQSGCQYTRSSTITYNLTNEDTFTRFLCESGDTGLCGTGTAIQYVNISVTEGSFTTNAPTTDVLSSASAQYIQIQAFPQTVNYRENDLVIVCSITNPSHLKAVLGIRLQKNSSTTFETVVTVDTLYTAPIRWNDDVLQNRCSVTGNLDSPSTAQLQFTIDKNSVQCPDDFKMYKCQMIGLISSTDNIMVAAQSNIIPISYNVKPYNIEMPRVKILNESFDTPNREFPVGTTITLTCLGEVGNDPSKTIRWCAQKAGENIFTGLAQTPIHSEASPSGCQYTRSSTITYHLTNEDTFTRFLCESGNTGLCGTGTAVQYVNISVTEGPFTTNAPTTDAYAQKNIHIQALPPTIYYRENDLVIVCSITNPSQLNTVFFLQILKNSSTGFDTVVSVATGQTPPVQWKDRNLQNRASATGRIDSPSTAQLKLTIDKNSVQCPADFKMYMCYMSGLNTDWSVAQQETSPITISYIVKPSVIELPRVRILNENFDTPNRQFHVATVIQLSCKGQVGSDQSNTIRWCAQKASENIFTGLPQTPIHSEASQSGCQYTRSSTITYNLTNEDTFTRFLCESGDTGMCGTGTAIQYVNISITERTSTNNTPTSDEGSSTINSYATDEGSYTTDEGISTFNSYTTDGERCGPWASCLSFTDVSDINNTLTTNGTSTAGPIAGGQMKIAVLILLPLLVI